MALHGNYPLMAPDADAIHHLEMARDTLRLNREDITQVNIIVLPY